MTAVTSFKCDTCGHIYKTEEECSKCESSHVKVSKILDVCYGGFAKYPTGIIVELENGEKASFDFDIKFS